MNEALHCSWVGDDADSLISCRASHLRSVWGLKSRSVWDLESGDFKRTLTGHKGLVWGFAVSPCGKQIISCSKDKTVW